MPLLRSDRVSRYLVAGPRGMLSLAVRCRIGPCFQCSNSRRTLLRQGSEGASPFSHRTQVVRLTKPYEPELLSVRLP